MQRVVSINLDGNVYPLDEKGYTALFAYLDATEARLKDSVDRARILADIERTIAEKCQACLGPHKTVITAGEIDKILSELEPVSGAPADAGRAPAAEGAASAGTGEKARTQSHTQSHTHRRLYQIREGGMVGGVCLGIATFLNIDVTIIRILFVLFAISTGGWGFLAYGGLMFILPRATTREQAQKPSDGEQQWPWDHDGWPWDRDGWPWDRHGWPWDRHGWPWDRDDRQQWRHEQRQARHEQRQARHEQRQERHEQRAERSRDGGGPQLFSSLVIAFSLILAFGWLSFWTRGGGYFGWPFFWGGPFYWGFPHWFSIILFFMLFRFLFMPLRIARWGWYGHPGHGPYGHPSAMWQGLIWLLMMSFFAWLAFHYIHEVRHFMQNVQAELPEPR